MMSTGWWKWAHRVCGSTSMPRTSGRLGAIVLDQRSTDGQQFLIEAAELPGAIDEMHLQNPVTFSPRRILGPHSTVVIRVHIQCDLVASDLLVRKLADQMARDGAAIFPARLFR